MQKLWQNFIHKIFEIKERLKIKSNQLFFCSITQSKFLNIYNKIIDMTGMIVNITHESLLKKI